MIRKPGPIYGSRPTACRDDSISVNFMFQLITGSYRALEASLLDEIATAKKADPLAPLLVLSPSARLLDRLQRQLAERAAYFNIHCLTFYALAERLLEDRAPTDDRVIGEPALYTEIIRDLLEGRGPTEFINRSFLHSPGKPLARGVPGALAETLRDLRDSGTRVVDALKAALEGQLGDSAPEAAPTLELYARVYEVLQKHGLRTPSDQLRRAADIAPKHAFIARQKVIYLYGFYDLTGVQLDLVLSLASHPDARIYFPYEAGAPAYAFAEKLLNDSALVQKIGKRKVLTETLKRHIKPPLPYGERSRPTEGKAEGEGIDPLTLTPTLSPKGRGSSAELWNCSGVQDEVWLAAKRIRFWAETKGIPFSEIALTARSLTPYLAAVREIFGANQIPYNLGANEPAGAWPLIKKAREILRNPSLPPLRGKVRMGGGPPTSILPLEGGGEPLLSWSVHARWAEELLCVPGTQLKNNAPCVPGTQDVLDAVRSLASLDVLGRPVSRGHFLEILEEKLDRLALPLSPSENSGVQVLDVMAARGMRFRAVCLLGLNEKSFPRLIREDPFLSDAARSALSGVLGCRLGRKMDGYQEERLLFHLGTALADDFLLLSTQRSDEEGKALVPSLYLQEWQSANSLKENHLPRTFLEKWLTVPVEFWTPKEVSLALNRERRDPVDLYKALGWEWKIYQTLKKAQLETENFRGGLGERDGNIGNNPVSDRLIEEGFSPHSLEELVECPFRYFARKVLDVAPLEEDVREGELGSDALGKLIHAILEEFYGRLSQSPSPLEGEGRDGGDKRRVHPPPVSSPSRGEESNWEKILDHSCVTCFKTFENDNSGVYPVIWFATQNAIRARLRAFLERDLAELKQSGYWPKETEMECSGKIPQLGDILFQGRIDRLDEKKEAGETVRRVVDYKTGRDKPGKTETLIMKGSFLQLPVYLGLAKAQEVAIYNLQELEKGGEPRSISADFWEEYGKKLAEGIKGLVSVVREGRFYIRPGDDFGQIYCDWCDYKTICRKNHQPTRFRSLHDPVRKKNEERLS